ncbi:MAG: guanylate kinase [Candidatus Parabeggiatoa sp. nov. 2]|nr:MAG: guanylate kinase [Beggiatoa sp. 4572_84]RKZ59659.1 MAG: guanylate kinase [Gammaproteobacteria bacterium]HEC84756.1 guanylate kinase [Thioploca sp.]
MSKGTLFTISAPSGAGKTTLVKALVESTDKIKVSVSHTTRKPRPGEKNNVNYHFVTEEEFMHKLTCNLFLEHAQIYDHYYGTSQKLLIEQLNAGIDVILEIDWQGAQQVHRLKPDTVGIFILPPSRAALEKRLRKRGKDSEEVIAKRLRGAVDEISHYVEFDYLVVNDDFSKALKDLQVIVHSQRLRQLAQAPKLEGLLTELLNSNGE